jgi:hypothetical protein
MREVASLVGTLTSTFPGVEIGPMHYRSIECDKTKALAENGRDYEAKIILSSESLGDLTWWVRGLPIAVREISHGGPSIVLSTDASLVGWGAQMGETCINGVWSEWEKTLHINCLELLAIKLALGSLCSGHHTTHIRIISDNVTAVSCINAMGGCKSASCNDVALEIWHWAIKQNNCLSAAHTPGSANVKADALSRNLNPNREWSVSTAVFN